MSAKYKKSEVFSYFQQVKGEFHARSHTISLNKGIRNFKHIFAFVLMQKCIRKNTCER